MSRNVRVNIRLTERQARVLHSEAERRGLSLSELMRRLMDAWLETLTDGGG